MWGDTVGITKFGDNELWMGAEVYLHRDRSIKTAPRSPSSHTLECAPRRRQVSEKTGNSIQSAHLERVFEQELRYTMCLTVRQASTLTDSRTFDDAAAT
jgi:hypothetical protein